MSTENYDSSNLLEVLNQHWTHARPVSKLSIIFLSIYFATFVGSFALVQQPSTNLVVPIALFGISFASVSIQIKYGLEFYQHIRLANVTGRILKIDNLMGRPLGIQTLQNEPKTPPLYSPQHWLVLIPTTGLGISLGWILWVIQEPFLATIVTIPITIAFMLTVFFIVRRFQNQIDNHVSSKTEMELY